MEASCCSIAVFAASLSSSVDDLNDGSIQVLAELSKEEAALSQLSMPAFADGGYRALAVAALPAMNLPISGVDVIFSPLSVVKTGVCAKIRDEMKGKTGELEGKKSSCFGIVFSNRSWPFSALHCTHTLRLLSGGSTAIWTSANLAVIRATS